VKIAGATANVKDNEFFSFDWRLAQPFQLNGGRLSVTPILEMFSGPVQPFAGMPFASPFGGGMS
jgi:hypothetical protein